MNGAKKIQAKILRITSVLTALWLATGIGAALAFVLQALMARFLGDADYGKLAGLTTGLAVLVPLCTMGVGQFWVQECSRNKGIDAKILANSVPIIALGCFLFALISCALLIFSDDLNYSKSFVIFSSFHVVGLAANELLGSKYQSEFNYRSLSLIQFTPHLLRLILGVALFELTNDANAFAMAYGVTGIFLIIRAAWSIGGPNSFKLAKTSEGRGHVFKRSSPFLIASLSHLVYFQSAIFAINILSTSADAGQYSAAFALIAAIYLIPGVVYQKFLLPKIHLWRSCDFKKYKQVFIFGCIAMLLLGLLISMVVREFSETIISIVYGDSYLKAASVLSILSLSIPFMFISHSAGSVLLDPAGIKLKAAAMCLVAGLNIFLCWVYIPDNGSIGAAYISLASNSVLAILYVAMAYKSIFKNGDGRG